MKILKLILKNAMRHKLRTTLTIIGIAIAVIAFGLLRTVVTAWYYGVDASANDRLVTRHSVSFIFPLPYAYRDKIANIQGVEQVSFANWFGGVYKDKNQFFARMAVDANTIFDVYPEFLISEKEKQAFLKERNACVVGSDIAQQYNMKLGDIITLEGDIYPGRWDFVLRGIYQPKTKTTDATQLFFHWEYLDERLRQESPNRAGDVGWYVVKINDPDQAAAVSDQIDAIFKNSPAETKTETEKAFAQGFVQASDAIINSMNIISFVIIGIIMLVLGNTMIMSARERTREYAVLKTLGFSAKHLVSLILGESMVISILGGALGLLLTYPIVSGFEANIPKGMFPVFQIEPITVIFAVTAALLVGFAASVFPIMRTLNTRIVDGFGHIG